MLGQWIYSKWSGAELRQSQLLKVNLGEYANMRVLRAIQAYLYSVGIIWNKMVMKIFGESICPACPKRNRKKGQVMLVRWLHYGQSETALINLEPWTKFYNKTDLNLIES